MHWTCYVHTHVCLNADCEQEQRGVVGKMEEYLDGLGEKFSDGDAGCFSITSPSYMDAHTSPSSPYLACTLLACHMT